MWTSVPLGPRSFSCVWSIVQPLALCPSTDEMMSQMDHLLIDCGYLHPGDAVVFVAGQPIGRQGTTNLMKLHRVGELR